MKILIVDDEAPARLRLRSMLERLPDTAVIGEAHNGLAAVEACRRRLPDVVLLDIRMPGMDGLEAAGHLARLDPPPAIIFTTAYDDYALAAFRSHAVDYLLKPVRREQLETALQAARRPNRAQLEALADAAHGDGEPGHISARVHGNIVLVPVPEIRYFQAEHKYVTVGHADGEVLIEDSLVQLEKRFGERFLRIHRNALVARQYLQALEKQADGRCHVRLAGVDKTLEVSRRHLPTVRRIMKEG